MKIVRCLAVGLLLCLSSRAWADNDTDGLLRPKVDLPEDPAISEAADAAHDAAEKKEAKQRDAKAKAESNWLLQGYEQQLQERTLTSGGPKETNLYTELTQDKELAKAAGLNSSNSDSSNPGQGELHAAINPGKPALALRPDPSLGSKPSFSRSDNTAFRPFITPLGATEAAGLHNFFEPVPALSTPIAQASSSTPQEAPSTDSEALDTPGLTAAGGDPAKEDPALTLDLLPGETLAEERSHHELALELPESSTTTRLRKQEDVSLRAPGQMSRTASAVPLSPLLLKQPPPDDTAAMVPDPSPIRVHLDDPYDILNR